MSIMDKLLKLSEVTYIYNNYDGEGKHLVVSNSTGASVVVNDDLVKFLENMRTPGKPSEHIGAEWEKETEKLYQAQILIDAGINGLELMNRAIQYHKNKSRLAVTLVTTNQCNLACPYCYEARSNEHMDTALIQRFLEYICKRMDDENIKSIHTSLFGGEPLLNPGACMEWFEGITRETKKRGVESVVALITNGTLINQEFLNDFCKIGKFYVQVTVDGPRQSHDVRRCYKNKKGTYDVILDNMSMILNSGVKIALRINIDNENQQYISDMIPDLVKRGLNNKNVIVNLERVASLTSSNCSYALNCIPSEAYNDAIIPHVINFKKAGFSLGFKMSNPIRPIYCSAFSDKQLTVTPSGDLYTCMGGVGDERFAVGNVWNDPVFDERIKDWIETSTMNFEECRKCPSIGFCGGGCGAEAISKYGSLKKGLVCMPLKWSYVGGVVLPADLRRQLADT